MSKTSQNEHVKLTKIRDRLAKTIHVNFVKPVEICAVVRSINIEEKTLIIESDDQNQMIECHTRENLTQLKQNDQIIVKGLIRLHPTDVGKILLLVDHLYTIKEEEKYANAIDIYGRLMTTLLNEKCKTIVNKLAFMVPPKVISNVALLVLQDNDQNIENFKTAFQEKCSGKLFIYHLKNGELESSIKGALEYFKKYHDIDLICLLTNQLTLGNICELSSKDNVKYMLNRKKVPYVISIMGNEKMPMEPLTAMLSNKKVVGIFECVEFIHNIQSSFQNEINKGIMTGTNKLKQILEKYRKKLFNLQMCMAELSDPRFTSKKSNHSLDELKNVLVQKLDKEKNLLYNTQGVIMKSIIDDPRMVGFAYPMIMESESNIRNEKSISTNQGRNPEINATARVEMNKPNGFPDADKIKKMALQQNVYFQEHPNELEPAKQAFDIISKTMIDQSTKDKFDKEKIDKEKIEKKIVNDGSNNTQNNKTITNPNGDFQ